MQALVVVGGFDESWQYLHSMLTLLPGSEAWESLPSLPQRLEGAQASIVGGRLRLTGGYGQGSYRTEVTKCDLETAHPGKSLGYVIRSVI